MTKKKKRDRLNLAKDIVLYFLAMEKGYFLDVCLF